MAQLLRVPDALLEDQSSILSIHVSWFKPPLQLQEDSMNPNTNVHTNTHIHVIKKKKML